MMYKISPKHFIQETKCATHTHVPWENPANISSSIDIETRWNIEKLFTRKRKQTKQTQVKADASFSPFPLQCKHRYCMMSMRHMSVGSWQAELYRSVEDLIRKFKLQIGYYYLWKAGFPGGQERACTMYLSLLDFGDVTHCVAYAGLYCSGPDLEYHSALGFITKQKRLKHH